MRGKHHTCCTILSGHHKPFLKCSLTHSPSPTQLLSADSASAQLSLYLASITTSLLPHLHTISDRSPPTHTQLLGANWGNPSKPKRLTESVSCTHPDSLPSMSCECPTLLPFTDRSVADCRVAAEGLQCSNRAGRVDMTGHSLHRNLQVK